MEAKIKQLVLDGLMLYCSANKNRKELYKQSLIETEIPNFKRMIDDPYYYDWDMADKLYASVVLLRVLNIYKNDIRLH